MTDEKVENLTVTKATEEESDELEDVTKLKLLLLEEKIDEEEYHKKFMESAKSVLEVNFRLEIKKTLSCKPHSLVVATEDVHSNEFAVKIIPSEKATVGDTEIWPYLTHNNILPIIRWEFVSAIDSHVMFLPLHPCKLLDMLECRAFLKDETACNTVHRWAGEITSALDYLHKRKLCHLGLRSKNVLISSNWTAVIFHFRTSDVSNIEAKWHDVDQCDTPPELWERSNRLPKIPIAEIPFEIWTLGMLVLNMYTGNYVHVNITSEEPCWHKHTYPVIYRILQKGKFTKHLRRTFPACKCHEDSIKIIMNFITSCLAIRPDERFSCQTLLNHRYFGKEGFMQEPEQVWKHKASEIKIQEIVHVYLDEKMEGALPDRHSGGVNNMPDGICEDLKCVCRSERRIFYPCRCQNDSVSTDEHLSKAVDSFIETEKKPSRSIISEFEVGPSESQHSELEKGTRNCEPKVMHSRENISPFDLDSLKDKDSKLSENSQELHQNPSLPASANDDNVPSTSKKV